MRRDCRGFGGVNLERGCANSLAAEEDCRQVCFDAGKGGRCEERPGEERNHEDRGRQVAGDQDPRDQKRRRQDR